MLDCEAHACLICGNPVIDGCEVFPKSEREKARDRTSAKIWDLCRDYGHTRKLGIVGNTSSFNDLPAAALQELLEEQYKEKVIIK